MPTPNTTKHSPLPWEKHIDDIVDAEDKVVCTLYAHDIKPDSDLILAAVNAMHALNPSNPMAAAENIVALVERVDSLLEGLRFVRVPLMDDVAALLRNDLTAVQNEETAE